MQRQQVRAAVWPLLEFDSSNGPIRFTLTNKGVGPAIIKHVILKVDNQPVKNWAEVLEKILGLGYHPGEESDMSGRVFAAAESMNVFTPHETQNPIPFDKSNPRWAKLDAGRGHVTVEICYCSMLGECWTLRAGGMTPGTTTETRRARLRRSLPFSSGRRVLMRQVWMRAFRICGRSLDGGPGGADSLLDFLFSRCQRIV